MAVREQTVEPVVLNEETAELLRRYLRLFGDEALVYCVGESCVVVEHERNYRAWPSGPTGQAALGELLERLKRVAELDREHERAVILFRRGEAPLSQVVAAWKAYERELEALQRKVLTDTKMYCRYVSCGDMIAEWLRDNDDEPDQCRELARLLARIVEPELSLSCDCEA